MSKKNILDREVLEVIKEQYDHIFSAERKVADFVLQNPQKAVDSNVSELAKQSGVNDATVSQDVPSHRLSWILPVPHFPCEGSGEEAVWQFGAG
ncbi:MAG: hypothetical protein ACLTLQ_06820 [[Clostridium] scindens]